MDFLRYKTFMLVAENKKTTEQSPLSARESLLK